MSLTQTQKDLIVGSLLGDGNLQTNTGQTWRFRAIQKAMHQPYIMHKYDILENFCKTPPRYSTVKDKRNDKFYHRYQFQTVFTDEFRFYGQMFYKKENSKWVKHVPDNIKLYLTPHALAFWYMDDGALKWANHSNAVRLCTDSFSLSEVNVLKSALEENFQLTASVQKKNNIARLSILEDSYPKLRELILPSLIPCMFYKFPDGNKGIYENEQVIDDVRNNFTERDLYDYDYDSLNDD